MIRVGVAGLGMMGTTHLDVYSQLEDANVVAVADKIEARRLGENIVQGNIEGQAEGRFDYSSVNKYEDAYQLIEDPDVDLVDICLTTPLHFEYARAALEAGKHVFVEKPLGLTSAEALALAELARKSPGKSMCGMCMRFWPGWTWLKNAIDSKEYGRVLSASFTRLAQHPGGAFYSDANQCGGAILDLHIHDTDFVQHCFGMPSAVSSIGYKQITGGIDHVSTRYEYPEIPMVIAEGGWSMAPQFGFRMQYRVNFELATACYDSQECEPLTIFQKQTRQIVKTELGMGYMPEIEYFLNCIRNDIQVEMATFDDSANSIRIFEAELESINNRCWVPLAS